MTTQGLLRPCAAQRCSAPFQRNSHGSSAIGQAGPGPGSSGTPVPPCVASMTAPRLFVPSLDRRDVLLLSSSLVMSHLMSLAGSGPAHSATQGIGRYIRRKTLDPLETYVPLVLEARALLSQAKALAAKDVGAARELLRQGPYNGLRDNIRAIGEYAARDGRTTEVGPLISGFFKALEGYDLLLYGALREEAPVSPDDVDAKVQDLYAAFDRLLSTVPPEILERANRVLQVTAAKAVEGDAAKGPGAGDAAAEDRASAPVLDEEAADLVLMLR